MFSNGFIPINLPKKEKQDQFEAKIKATRRKIWSTSLGI